MNIYEKLSAIQQELIAPKNQFNKFGNYNYRSCEDILEGLKPCLEKVKAAVTISDELVLIGERYYIKATANLIDCESEVLKFISNTAYAREEENVKGMSSSQITGSASSYARKYALNGLFCIDDVKDADSRDNSKNEAHAKPQHAKETEPTEQDIQNMKIAEIKVKALVQRCETDGVSESTILNLYKIKSFADITELQFRNMNDNWEKIKAMK